MSEEKKYVVPEGMLEAATKVAYSVVWDGPWIEKCLEAALEWLAENPIRPNVRQMDELIAFARVGKGSVLDEDSILMHLVPVEWQRRMFLAPEPEIRPHVRDMFRGRTLTHAEADYIVEELRKVSPGWEVPK